MEGDQAGLGGQADSSLPPKYLLHGLRQGSPCAFAECCVFYKLNDDCASP